MSAWLFDLGNTRLKFAPLPTDVSAGVQPSQVVAIAHVDGQLGLRDAASSPALPDHFDVAYVASVAPEALRVELLDELTRRCTRIELARTQSSMLGLHVAYADPSRLGVDRFLAMLGARDVATGAVLVCGVGTALTLDLVDSDGRHLGGRIAPSPALMRDALHARAPHLPAHGGQWVDWAISTDDALESGCNDAALALVEQALAQARDRVQAPVTLLLHGGGADEIVARFPHAVHASALVLQGLAAWARSG